VIHETPWVAIYHKLNPDTTYAILEPFTTENLGIALNKGNTEMVEVLNKFLKKYKENPEYKQAHQYWFVDMPWWDSVPQKK
jgi:ABC-type amino acid transport substrate-binding protein